MPSPNGYGALPSSGNVSTNAGSGDEEQPLLGARPSKSPSWRRRMMADVRRERADIVLLLCYVITGLLDSASISAWGSFVSMQTGNTVYFGLGLAAPHESTRWIKSGTSLGCFCVGSVFFSSFHRRFSPKRRWVLCASFAIQMALIIGAAAIVTFGPSPSSSPSSFSPKSSPSSSPSPSPDSGSPLARKPDVDPRESIAWTVLAPIALVAFQSCGQAVTSRALKYNALTSVVLTSIYCDLFSDAAILAPRNVERNQRVAAPLSLLFGAVMGGLLARGVLGIAGTLWIAAGLKLAVVITWLAWPSEEE